MAIRRFAPAAAARRRLNAQMLVPIIFVLAFMLTLGGVVLEGGFRAAKAAMSASVARSSDAAIADGVADFTHGLAGFVERHGARGPWPQQTSSSAPRSACASTAACSVHYVITARITNASAGTGDSGDGDAAVNLQTAAIDEQRVSAVVTVQLESEAGVALGTRTRFLTYRVFETAPYAVVSGVRDSTTVDGSRSTAQGDSGGASGSPAAPGTGSADEADDTRIHVRLSCRTVIAGVVPFVNDQQVAGNDGLPWGDTPQAAYEAPCTSPDAPVDAFTDQRWTNGDANASGWTQ